MVVLTEEGPLTHSLSLDELEIRDISQNRGRDFIKKHHYSGGCGTASMIWGLFHEDGDEMLGAAAFQTPISENVRDAIFGDGICDCELVSNSECKRDDCLIEEEHHHYAQHVTELHRFVTLDACPKNTETWFLSRALDALKEYKEKYWAVVSFADQTEGHKGTIYQATNAIYYGATGESTFYRDEDGNLRPPRICGENISVTQAKERGWEPEKRKAKHRYLFLLEDNTPLFEPNLSEMVEVDQQPYPSE